MKAAAVCCGFNNYVEKAIARGINDAALLYTKLTENRAFNSEPALIGAGALFTQNTTSSEVISAFSRAAASNAELVWFSFSGHAIIAPDGELRLLLPEWRYGDSDEQRARFSIGARDLDRVISQQLGSKRFVLIIDACYSGAFDGVALTRDITLDKPSASSTGAVVITACTREQVASDGRASGGELTGVFTNAVIKVLEDRMRSGFSLAVFDLFMEARREVSNGQRPTLHARALTDDFLILMDAANEPTRAYENRIVRMPVEVPARLKNELAKFLDSVTHICRNGRVGLVHAERQLESLAAEFYNYRGDTFVVPGHNANVIEVFDSARTTIIGCTTPAYVNEWHRSGVALRKANELFIKNGGRVTRFFFVRRDFRDRVPAVQNVIRDHVKAGISAVVVDVDSFGPTVLQEVFRNSRPEDISQLECAFVDGRIFFRTHFTAGDELKIEVAQTETRCQDEYKAHLRPFLDARDGILCLAILDPSDDEDIALPVMTAEDVSRLRQQLDKDLGLVKPMDCFGYECRYVSKDAPEQER